MLLVNQQDLSTARNTYAFRAAPGAGELPSIAVAAARLYLPAIPIEVVGFDVWSPAADPLVGAGGAANIRIALANGAHGTLTFLINSTIATLNGNSEGGGFYSGGGGTSNVKASFNLYPGSFLDGTNATTRELAVSSDAGTINGKLILQLSYRVRFSAGALP